MIELSLLDLSIAFMPVALVLVILARWQMKVGESVYGFTRMLAQLLIVGYFLNYLFAANEGWIIIAVLSVMVFASSFIALRSLEKPWGRLFAYACISILLGGGFTLIIITQGVLGLDPWYAPTYVIPLAGMIFAGSMNAISVAAERLQSELKAGKDYSAARPIALNAGLIPITNSLFAVGLVSLPGMMTGQILSGIDPLIAVRYQIMVMCMMYASAGLSASCFLWLRRP